MTVFAVSEVVALIGLCFASWAPAILLLGVRRCARAFALRADSGHYAR